MSDTTRDLTQGPVWRALTAMSAPMMLGILAVLSVGLADAYFLGLLGGTPLAAVGFIYPVTAAITSLSIGLAAGANAAVSQAIGRHDSDADAARIGLHAFALGVVLAVVVGLTLYLLFPTLFALLGASDAVLTEIKAFMPWWCLSFPFLVITMLINALFRAHGNSRISAGFMSAEAILNIGLTPLLIFGWGFVPGFETAGAAMATFLARLVICVLAFAYAVRRDLLGLGNDLTKNLGRSLKEVTKVGGPAALSNAINPAGMALVTAAVATVGEAAVGGFGAATRIQSIVLVPMLGLSSGIGPVVGQNWGAEKYDRAAQGLQASYIFCLGYGLLTGAGLAIFAEPLANLLASGNDATEYAATYLRIVGWSLFGYGFVVVTNAAMNARSKAVWSTGLSLGRIMLVYLPFAWLGVTAFGYVGITAAAVAANVIAAAAALGAAYATGLLRKKTLNRTFA